MKYCKRCEQSKDVDCFAKNGKMGRHPVCKLCRAEIERERRLADPEAIRALERARHAANPAIKKAAIRRYYEANRDALIAKTKAASLLRREEIAASKAVYRAANKDRIREWNGTRRAQQRQAMPVWADRKAIAAIYKQASEAWKQTGIAHHVDHIVPLSHKYVCGLHVPANLQVLTGKENMEKRNKFAV